MRNLVILGASGSIGRQTLEVIDHYKDEFNLIGVSVYENVEALKNILKKYPSIKYVYMKHIDDTLTKLYAHITFFDKEEGLISIMGKNDVDVIVNGISGFKGVVPTYYALKNNKEVCLANKESLVCAGDLINDLLNKGIGKLYPVDSEHCAIRQCLEGEKQKTIKNLIITASGGPFRSKELSELTNVSVNEALNHPTWKMGQKITIDSATLFNKGLEVIEAHYLFNVVPSHIKVVIHPTSIIHSMVEFCDGTIKAQLGVPSMRLPIQYALLKNNHGEAYHEDFDFTKHWNLEFYPCDLTRFGAVKLAYKVLELKKGYPIAYNASNEVAVHAFLEHKIKFLQIEEVVKNVLDEFKPQEVNSIDDVVKIDEEVRKLTTTFIKERI